MIMDLSKQNIAKTIDAYLRGKYSNDLPTYYYMVGNVDNSGFIITPVEYEGTKYFDINNYYYQFELRLLMSKTQHQQQLTLMNEIISALTDAEFDEYFTQFGLKLNKKSLNKLDVPRSDDIEPTLETFDNTHQIYYVTLGLILYVTEEGDIQ